MAKASDAALPARAGPPVKGTDLAMESMNTARGCGRHLQPPLHAGLTRFARACAVDLDPACRGRLAQVAVERRRLQRGATLFCPGEALTALYEIDVGLFKTSLSDENGRCQVTGFPMSGDLLGLGALGNGSHGADAVALEDAQVSVIPFEALSELFREFADLQHEFHKIMSREIMREQSMMLLLGTMSAEGRVAAFLLDMTQRLHERGYSSAALVLRMTREEIGSYLGLQLETVSRTLSKLQQVGVIDIRNREVLVRDAGSLRRMVQGAR